MSKEARVKIIHPAHLSGVKGKIKETQANGHYLITIRSRQGELTMAFHESQLEITP